MFEIIKNGETIELQESLNWVRYQSNNDTVVSCNEDIGQGILCGSYVTDDTGNQVWQANSVIYSVAGKPQCKDYEFVTIEEIKWYSVSQKQRSDIDFIAIMVDIDLEV